MFILGIIAAVCIIAAAAIHAESLDGFHDTPIVYILSAAEILFLVVGVELIFKAVN